MANEPKRTGPDPIQASQHLSVRPDDGRPPELRFMFESASQNRVGSAFGASVVGHAAFLGLWVFILWLVPDVRATERFAQLKGHLWDTLRANRSETGQAEDT